MDAEEVRSLERLVARLMQAEIEARLFLTPDVVCAVLDPGPPVFGFYCFKS
jgi:hypothetical protein